MIKLCSTCTVSPAFTSTSITSTSLKSPISGTSTSCTPPAACAGAAAGAAAEAGAATCAGAAACAAPDASTSSTTVPSATLSPTFTLMFLTTPACELGISIEALSDSTVIRLCSTAMVSPTLTKTSITSTSLKSPISGTLTSISVLIFIVLY